MNGLLIPILSLLMLSVPTHASDFIQFLSGPPEGRSPEAFSKYTTGDHRMPSNLLLNKKHIISCDFASTNDVIIETTTRFVWLFGFALDDGPMSLSDHLTDPEGKSISKKLSAIQVGARLTGKFMVKGIVTVPKPIDTRAQNGVKEKLKEPVPK